jgi:ribonuclease J
MRPTVTCFGGVGEIGGNKILLRDKDTQVFLDFGTGFTDGEGYFDAGITPRRVNGAGDLFEFGLLPEIPGLYSEDALQNTSMKHVAPEVDAIVLSHYHWDHVGRTGYVDCEIPVYCGETTKLIHEAVSKCGGSPLEGHTIKTFRTGDKLRIGSLEIVPVHVDHSIPGAYGFLVHTTEGTLAYTGDFRYHGPAGSMTQDFAAKAHDARPSMLIAEGTRVSKAAVDQGTSEESVLGEASKAMKRKGRLVFSSFRGNDVDRVRTFHRAALATGRQLVVSMKTAVLLDELSKDPGIEVPKVGKDVRVYVRRKGSGTGDDRDYYRWERPYLSHGISASGVRERQGEIFLHLDVWNIPEMIDVKPDRGGAYIHSSSEAFNEEGEREEDVIKNWISHLGFSYHQIHASGHAPKAGVERLVSDIHPERVLPVHTEFPGDFVSFGFKVILPKKGRPNHC